jgi:hypothetical protein
MLDAALQTEFFRRFHKEETERRPEEPREEVRFLPFRRKIPRTLLPGRFDGSPGELLRMELVVRRDRHFAQDLVKSLLLAALPDACRAVLKNLIEEMTDFSGGKGVTPGYLVRTAAGVESEDWLDASIANLPLKVAASLVVQLYPNPEAPNSVLLKGRFATDEGELEAW